MGGFLMKSKIILFSTLALGMAAVVAAGALPVNASKASAYGPDDTYVTTADHFVASIHKNKAVRDAYNGDDNNLDSSRLENVTISNMDPTSSISWKVSVAKYSYDPNDFRSIMMGNGSSTIEGHADANFAEIYSALNLGDDVHHYVSAMYSTTTISNIRDFAFTWGGVKGDLHSENQGNVYFLYKLAEGNWTPIYYKKNNSRTYYDGLYATDDPATAKTWNHHRANIKNEYVAFSGLDGATAQLAIAYDAGTSSSSNYICLQTIIVNRVSSAKATMHYWDKLGADVELCEWITTSNGSNHVKLAMFAKSIEQSQVDELNVAANFEYNNAKEATYYAQLAYLCGQAGISLNLTPTPASAPQAFFESNKSYLFSIAAASITVGILGIALLAFKKKKHN